jgi:hypothetical protein
LQLVVRMPTDDSNILTCKLHRDMALTVLQEDFVSFYSSAGDALGVMFSTIEHRISFERVINKLLQMYASDAAFEATQAAAASAAAAAALASTNAPAAASASSAESTSSSLSESLLGGLQYLTNTGLSLIQDNLLGPSAEAQEFSRRARSLSVSQKSGLGTEDALVPDRRSLPSLAGVAEDADEVRTPMASRSAVTAKRVVRVDHVRTSSASTNVSISTSGG